MPPGRKTLFVALAVLALAVLAGCGQTTERPLETTERGPQKIPATDAADPLTDTEWTLRSLRGEGLVEGTNITLDIEKNAYRGNAGCNWYGGRYTSGNGVLEISGSDMTQMGCPRETGQQENTYLNTLQNVATYRFRGDSLELRNSADEIILVYTRRPRWDSNPAELVDTRWKLRSLNGKSPEEGSTPTLSFESEKRYSGYDGCRNFTGAYVATTDDLEFPSVTMKDLDCMKPVPLVGADDPIGSMPIGGDYRLDENRLEIRTVEKSTYVFVPLAEGEEVARATVPWKLEKFVRNGSATPVSEGTKITIAFDRGTLRKRGTVRGSAGCNEYTANYVYRFYQDGLEGPNFKDSAVTRKLCRSPEGIMEQELRYLDVLEDARGYYQKIDGRLYLETGDGRKLVFAAPG